MTDHAAKAIESLMMASVGSGKHFVGEWRTESLDHHLHRAAGHLERWRGVQHGVREPDGEDHLQQALCRVAMALAIREGERNAGKTYSE